MHDGECPVNCCGTEPAWHCCTGSLRKLVPIADKLICLGHIVGMTKPDLCWKFTHGGSVQGIYKCDDMEVLAAAMNEGTLPPEKVRFFLGYAGWVVAQLAWEVEVGSWWVAAASSSLIRECMQGRLPAISCCWKVALRHLACIHSASDAMRWDPNCMQQPAAASCDSADRVATSHGQSSAGLSSGWSTHPEEMFGHWNGGCRNGCWRSATAAAGSVHTVNGVPCHNVAAVLSSTVISPFVTCLG